MQRFTATADQLREFFGDKHGGVASPMYVHLRHIDAHTKTLRFLLWFSACSGFQATELGSPCTVDLLADRQNRASAGEKRT
jgi:hypothetical protein